LGRHGEAGLCEERSGLQLIAPVAALATAAATDAARTAIGLSTASAAVSASAFCHYLAPSLVERLVDSEAICIWAANGARSP